jgi:hypothetical protein
MNPPRKSRLRAPWKLALAIGVSVVLAVSLTGCVFDVGFFTNALNCLAGNEAACAEIEKLDPDADNDHIVDNFDNCSGYFNPGQQDSDHDGLGDACDLHLDSETATGPGDPPPAAPTGLTATPNNDFSASLDWTDAAASNIRKYHVLRSTTAGGPYNDEVGTPTASEYRDANLARRTVYYYVVKAEDAGGKLSAPSSEASAEPCGPPAEAPPHCTSSPGRVVAARAARKPRTVLTLRLRAFRQGFGSVRLVNGTVTGKGGFAAGVFRAALRGVGGGPALAPAKDDNWRASYDFTIDSKAHKAVVKGLALLDFPAPTSGRLCLSFTNRIVLAGSNRFKASGTFKTVGGSGAARRVRAAGKYSSARDSKGIWTLRGRVPSRRVKSAPLPRRCRALAAHR